MLASLDASLELFEVGRLNHSHWLSLGCHVLCFYAAQEKAIIYLGYIGRMKVYFSSSFEIKSRNKNTNGSVYFFNIVERVMKFPNKTV